METRHFKIENVRAEGKRTVKASISSEYPVARMNGKKEILVHTPEAVDLSRAPLPLITDHNAQQLNVGVVEDLRIIDKKLKGTLRFGSSSRAMEIWQDVKDGILTGLSVSYEVQETEDAGEYYLVTRWMPLEVSLVSVPADPSVGVGRSFERINNMEENYLDDIQKQHKTLDGMTPDAIEKYLEGRRQVDVIKANMIEVSGEKTNNRTGGFRSMGEFLQSVARYHAGGGMDRRLETRYLKEGTGSAGGFLLQPEYINEIMSNVWSSGEVLKRVWSIPMQTNTLKIPAIDESSRATGSRWGGAQAYWIDEGGTKQESEPKFRRLELNLNKAVVLVPATDEVLEDAQALEAVIRSVAAKEITFCLEDAIINGTGAGRPLGIINAGATVTVNKETGQAASTVVFENIVKMWARMKEDSLANAVWFINQTVWPELFNMYLAVGTGGSAVYLPGGGLSDAPYGTLMGKPVIPIEQCQALGTAGDIILADMSKYVWAYREMQSAMSIHVYFTTDKSVFRFVARVDGQPILASPITPYKGGASNTLSDFVILESR
jgi:HK97 family phage major capsid protein/HK97 family phage prohead protease